MGSKLHVKEVYTSEGFLHLTLPPEANAGAEPVDDAGGGAGERQQRQDLLEDEEGVAGDVGADLDDAVSDVGDAEEHQQRRNTAGRRTSPRCHPADRGLPLPAATRARDLATTPTGTRAPETSDCAPARKTGARATRAA